MEAPASASRQSQALEWLGASLALGPGDSPFPWQVRLLEQLMGGELPRSLDIPTGLGKTATMAIWLVARASGASLPRRLIYVVDRRAVVDQATEEAMRLRAWVAGNEPVRRGLGLEDRALPISTLRGQFVDNRQWLEDPACAAIVVGTVDMVGSRLLFCGYGTSHKMRPFHAGLIGNDTLLVLDEAHLVPPFERLLETVASKSAGLGMSDKTHPDSLAVPPALQLLSLSATGRSRGGPALALDVSDEDHLVLARRLCAPKRLSLEDLNPEEDMASALAERAWALADEGARHIRCIVYVNSRRVAEQARARLGKLAGSDKRRKGSEPAADVLLLVGGRRIFERQAAAERLRDLGFLAGPEPRRSRPAFLIATSAGEVGVDLDADDMVCDLVSWERMVQRLGRVNRRGLGDARVQVLVVAPSDKASPANAAQHDALLRLIDRLPRNGTDDHHDASPGAIYQLQCEARTDPDLERLIDTASTPAPLHPALDRPTVDAWSMTSLREHPGRPSVAPWLRGWIEDRPQTTLLWRQYLPIPVGAEPDETQVARFFAAARPHASEKLVAESWQVADWLLKRVRQLLKAATKARVDNSCPGAQTVLLIDLGTGDPRVRTWTLHQLGDESKKRLSEQLLPGRTLVMDARFAGLAESGLLDGTHDEVPPTLDGPRWLEPSAGPEAPPVPFRVRLCDDPAAVEDVNWRERERFPETCGADGEVTRWWVVEKWRHMSATEDDRSAGRPQLLTEHLEWTAERARDLCHRLALGPDATRVLVTAARLHDEGKRSDRWQGAFHAPRDGVYAKTRGPLDVHWLDGYRHEFGSLAYAERDVGLRAMPPGQQDLVLHLIASHHGFARPVISTRGCDAPPSVLEARAKAVALRFAELQQRWGPWGLAWWECLLRAADHQASRDNDVADTVQAMGGA